jgi:hypothetical protein
MDKPDRCPECGCTAIMQTTRHHSVDGTIHAFMCRECHWISDPRVGRPPADHSKNVTLRRLIADVAGGSGSEHQDEESPRDNP